MDANDYIRDAVAVIVTASIGYAVVWAACKWITDYNIQFWFLGE